MNIIKKAFVDCILKKHTVYEQTLQYTPESTENKAERLLYTINKIANIL